SVHHIWCPLFSQEFQDLPDGAETTLTKSRGSALIGIFQNGQLTWLSGTATGLTPPAGITAGSVVYVN
uniref:type IV pilus biogenesis protein PilM n=1 Tax=Salmonella enterica TaxID=28901 RepID=UPI0021751F55